MGTAFLQGTHIYTGHLVFKCTCTGAKIEKLTVRGIASLSEAKGILLLTYITPKKLRILNILNFFCGVCICYACHSAYMHYTKKVKDM